MTSTEQMLTKSTKDQPIHTQAQDLEFTNKLVEVSKLLDLKVLDHIIVSPSDGGYTSFADDGIIS